MYDRPYGFGLTSSGCVEVFHFVASTGSFASLQTLPSAEIQHLIRTEKGHLFGSGGTQLHCIKRAAFFCYNCGSPNDHFSKNCPNLEQQFSRCPMCQVVARTAAGHKITCTNTDFVSTKLGEYELPLMSRHSLRFVFKNVIEIFCAESTEAGLKNFIITKFFSSGNINIERVYNTDDIIIDVAYKPSISLSVGRIDSTEILASILCCGDQIRINHYQHIDKQGKVTYSLSSHPKKDSSHDIDIKLRSNQEIIFCSLSWNDIKLSVSIQ